MSDTSFDIAIIGGGPGGYVAAIRAAQLGFNTVCIEKRGALGGTCLNVGCIPSKALLHSSHLYDEANGHFADHGIAIKGLSLDLPTMMGRKDKVVDDLTNGIEFLFKKNKVTYVKGAASLLGGGKVAVEGSEDISAKHIILATGSEVTPLPGVDIDEKRIVSSTGALALSEVPEELVVVGGGVIGLELGSVWSRLGSNVTVVEFLDRIIPGTDSEIAKTFQRSLKKQGLKFKLSTKVMAAKVKGKKVNLTLESVKKGTSEEMTADAVLIAIGRRPYVDGLGLETVGVELSDRGQIKITDGYKTTADNVYAIGDVVEGPMLAHKAEEEGVAIVEMLAGQKPHVNYDFIPGIIYTSPEVATVGKTEDELKEAGVEVRIGKFPMQANSRARTSGATDGMVKIIADAKTDRVLGCHIIASDAGALIHEAIAVMEFGGSAEDIARTCHGHPTSSEAVKEAALAVDGRPIHV